ncbi:methionine adenosyltransferase [Candidatus Woesearchaeota archaeon]|jgi:S-adenosylmethionine synthetase|nr:methionine adenosyltransferase [Candidatus Woesearchaeota archaeon]MBT4368071.1 methionine adenosyltransferase [Candidatus Woesearchaeota archaeon]MBT4712559.1 methionine adenosyltransferase [Candidatus Woesearchaeota archaeon]MBT6639472.1 methionine adenosyltransferase [Candidatus Woesearchaeota archaeon]MBT7133644.1 methionine adenosyltransferase [Candidatus Woesearchaeota archaeon]
MAFENGIFTSESVTEGHPDKVCDQISDGVVDAALAQDPGARVACETSAKGNNVLLAGEITCDGEFDGEMIVKSTLEDIGYDRDEFGTNWENTQVTQWLTQQSPDISQGVSLGQGLYEEQGAGDQGMMFGYACNDTPELMPLPIALAQRLARRLTDVRKTNVVGYLGPDGKSQVSVVYSAGRPVRLSNVVISTQHLPDAEHGQIVEDMANYVISEVCHGWMDDDTIIHVNPTGRFVLGGPFADAGLTGRKIIVDTYGGMGRHGGGAFSGKDPSKVDRSGAYAARFIAKNVVAANLADKAEVQIAFAIGVADPVSIAIETYGTERVCPEKLERVVRETFPVKPADILSHFDLREPHQNGWSYKDTAAYGHFGRTDVAFPWESTEKVAELIRRF